MNADARALARRIQSGQRRLAAHIGHNSTHRIVHRRTDGDGRDHRIHAHKGLGDFGDQRQAFENLFFAKVAQIEMHCGSLGCVEGASLLLLLPERLRQAVPRPQFHSLRPRPRIKRPKTVILQVAVTVLVEQNAALAAAAFSDQNAGARQRGGMPLHEFHVTQRRAVAVSHAHAFAGDNAGVGVLPVDAARAAGGHHHTRALEQKKFAARNLERQHAADVSVLDHQVGAKKFIVALDGLKPQRGLE